MSDGRIGGGGSGEKTGLVMLVVALALLVLGVIAAYYLIPPINIVNVIK